MRQSSIIVVYIHILLPISISACQKITGTYDSLACFELKRLDQTPKLDFVLSSSDTGLSALNKVAQYFPDNRQLIKIRMLIFCPFVDRFQEKVEARQTGYWAGDEGD
jgi:hypothetical protein